MTTVEVVRALLVQCEECGRDGWWRPGDDWVAHPGGTECRVRHATPVEVVP